ncbi:MAG: septum formation initiator family protein [bacterium]
MRNFQKKRGWRNIIQSKLFLILFGIAILVFSWNVFGFWNKMQETEKNKKIVEDRVTALKQQKENISSEMNNLNTDQGKEKFFRENLGLAKEGEEVIIVVEDKNPPPAPLPVSSGFFSFFTNWFK